MKIFAPLHHNRTINIVIEFADNILSSDEPRVQHRKNVPEKDRYTQEQLDWYNDLIDNVVYAIAETYQFKISQEYQSNDSYSYYIQFEAFTSEGESLGDFEIKFRISDHVERSKRRLRNRGSNQDTAENQLKRSKVLFRSIYVNEVSKVGMMDVMKTIWEVCDGLLAGDLSVIDQLGR